MWEIAIGKLHMFFETSPTKKSEVRVVRIQEGDYIERSPKRIATASFSKGFWLGRDSGSDCSNGSIAVTVTAVNHNKISKLKSFRDLEDIWCLKISPLQ